MKLYSDEYLFTDNIISKLIELCSLHEIIYLQLFGSYTKEKASGNFRDIDLLIMFKDSSNLKDLEKLNIEFSNILNHKADISPMDYLSNKFKSSILSSKYVTYKNELFDDIICSSVETVLHWYETEGRRELLSVGRKAYFKKGQKSVIISKYRFPAFTDVSQFIFLILN